MPTVETCPAGQEKYETYNSPSCGTYYGCRSITSIPTGNIIIRARGVVGDESIDLKVNGNTIKTWTLSTSYQDYSTSATVSSTDTVTVNFTNDAGDRDVQVDYAIINGTTYQTENQATNTGSWNFDTGACGGVPSEWLYCNGYIEFKVGNPNPAPAPVPIPVPTPIPTPQETCGNGSCLGGESCNTCPRDCGECPSGPGSFKVVGYFASWAGNEANIQYDYLTHINYAFLFPTTDGSLNWEGTGSMLDSVVSNGHANGVKVLIAIGGWHNGDDSAFHTLAANSSTRANFVNNVANFVSQHNLDGADIDWEFPDNDSNFTQLMADLSSRLHGAGKLLTAATGGTDNYGTPNDIFPYVDYLNLMAYINGQNYGAAEATVNHWQGEGLDRSKMILGVPFYVVQGGVEVPYSAYIADNPSASAGIIQTIKDMTTLAASRAGGVMIWAIDSDTSGSNSLLKALHDVAPAY
jgi:hypothetical protein